MESAFSAGNFAELRLLAARAANEPDKKLAADMMSRIAVDPLINYLTIGCIVLFCLVAAFVR